MAAGYGPALGLACMCMPRGVLVGLCAGCRLSTGVDKRAQAPTRDRSQACFFRVIMRAFISLQILPAALVRLCACARVPKWAMRRQPQLTVLIVCCALVPRRLGSGRSSTPHIAVILWNFLDVSALS